jgi:mono/diheme cytochrome c family protein
MALPLPFASVLVVLAPEPAAADAAALEAKVKAIFDDQCTSCHSAGGDPKDPAGLDLEASPATLVGKKSAANGKPLVTAGKPGQSYLLDKLFGSPGIAGELMPLGGDPLPEAQLRTIEEWIVAMPARAEPVDDGPGPGPDGVTDPVTGPDTGPRPIPQKRAPKPFHGQHQSVLPTTATLGRRTLQYRIDHRFGRIGTERGAFGFDAGVIMSMGLAYGILDGWDVRLRRTNSRKGWELSTVYVPVRQEAGMPLSFGAHVGVNFFRDFDVANPWTGDIVLMLSRLWFERWSTMITLGYHFNTNHNPRVMVDLPGDNEGPVLVNDRRDTMTLGFASTVWLGKRRRWGIDVEWLLPIPDGADPNEFYYRGGDADPTGTKLGAWTIGGSYLIGKHFFQVFFTNNREIHINLAAPGGQAKNPFNTPGIDPKNPFHEANFFLGFNLGRNFSFGPPKKRGGKKAKKAKAKKGAGA